jgi:hypothetical protein
MFALMGQGFDLCIPYCLFVCSSFVGHYFFDLLVYVLGFRMHIKVL